MSTSSPARLYCTLVGVVLVIAGIVGFFYSSGFDTGAAGVRRDSEEMFGFLAVNGWHNVVHILLGVVALAVAGSPSGARSFCLGIGLAFFVVAIWGLIDGDGVILGLIPLNDGDNIVSLLLGLAGLGAGAATEKTEAPARRPTPST